MSAYGIDLGTTYSCISKLDDHGNPIIIKNQADQSDTLASAVYFETEDNVIVGNNAKDMVETDGDRVVEFIKREIGRPNGKNYEFDGKTYTPVEISALILKRLIEMVREQGGDVTDVVITCPAYFGIEERNATRAAGELAGLNVLNIVNEPTAAALSYCARQFKEEQTIMVYDLGGGTFDVTIIRMSLEENEDGAEVQNIVVVATGGNDKLGGKDWDDILYNHIQNACCDENGLSIEDLESETKQQIRSRVEDAKKKLSSRESAKVKISVNGSMTNIPVTREEFESMTAGKVDQTMGYVDAVMEKAGNPKLDLILLVGGSTFMPMIRNAVEARFSGIPVNLHEPNLAVAKGAAIYADMLVNETTDTEQPIPGPQPSNDESDTGTVNVQPTKTTTVFTDVLSRSFGPGVKNEAGEYIIDNLVKKDSYSPAEVQRIYYTERDNMSKIQLKVFESLSEEDTVVPCEDGRGNPMPSDPAYAVKYLGKLEMELPPGTPGGTPIEVTFRAEIMGIYVHTLEPDSGIEADATISFKTDIDMENSPVHGMSVGDGE